jgi:hypothetical protein
VGGGVLAGATIAMIWHYKHLAAHNNHRRNNLASQGIALQTLSYGAVPDMDIAESYVFFVVVAMYALCQHILFFLVCLLHTGVSHIHTHIYISTHNLNIYPQFQFQMYEP